MVPKGQLRDLVVGQECSYMGQKFSCVKHKQKCVCRQAFPVIDKAMHVKMFVELTITVSLYSVFTNATRVKLVLHLSQCIK